MGRPSRLWRSADHPRPLIRFGLKPYRDDGRVLLNVQQIIRRDKGVRERSARKEQLSLASDYSRFWSRLLRRMALPERTE